MSAELSRRFHKAVAMELSRIFTADYMQLLLFTVNNKQNHIYQQLFSCESSTFSKASQYPPQSLRPVTVLRFRPFR